LFLFSILNEEDDSWGPPVGEIEGKPLDCLPGTIWEPKLKMGSKRLKLSLQQSTYTGDLFCCLRGTTQIWASSFLETHLQKGFSFGSCCWRKCRICIEPFVCSVTQKTNRSCILGVVIGDSLRIERMRFRKVVGNIEDIERIYYWDASPSGEERKELYIS
jgi:hypothetical protein